MLILEKFIVASSLLFNMACLTTIATTSSDFHWNATLCLKNKPLVLVHISNLFHICCLYPILLKYVFSFFPYVSTLFCKQSDNF